MARSAQALKLNSRQQGWSVARTSLVLALIAGAMVLGALLWPSATCVDPACARPRFHVLLEIDSFEGAQPPPFEIQQQDRRVTMESVLASGGIELTRLMDESNLPFHPSQGRLDRADLFQFLEVWRNARDTTDVDAHLYALITTAGLVADNGEPVFGIMFDYDGREGFAVAPHESIRAFGRLDPDNVGVAQMRTFLHELLHALNRSHLDGARFPDDRLSLEAPTKCIAHQSADGWRLREEPLMALSPSTIGFFQAAPPADVLPGARSTPFDVSRVSARDCDIARETRVRAAFVNRWGYMLYRLSSMLGMSAHAADDEIAQLPVRLDLQAQTAPYPLGYPIAVRIVATNTSDEPLPLRHRLDPSYGLVHIETRAVGEEDWTEVHPIAFFETIDDSEALVLPGASTEQTVPIYYSDAGWTFTTAGRHEVRARLVLDEDQEVTSEVLSIEVAAPSSEEERAVLQQFTDENGNLDREVGRLLFFGGRISSADAHEQIEQLLAEHPESPIAASVSLALASRLLRPRINARTGERPPPDVPAARRMLANACTDSGVTALKLQLLSRHDEVMTEAGNSLLPRTEFEAWEGTTRRGIGPVLTYSNPLLTRLPVSLHFCLDQERLQGAPATEMRRIARELSRERPERVVVVGHADHFGTCNYNDTLAMRRAETVREALVRAGIRGDRVVAVSLGKQRPLHFESSDEAASRNRRVEILVERSDDSEGESADPESRAILPTCSR